MTLMERHKKAAELLPEVSSLIGGERFAGSSTGTFDHINPATGRAQSSVPLSGTDCVDAAVAAAQVACPGYEVVTVDCSALICQHGSLHCSTMQIPREVFP